MATQAQDKTASISKKVSIEGDLAIVGLYVVVL